jgi:hypothetical protein
MGLAEKLNATSTSDAGVEIDPTFVYRLSVDL